MSNSTLLSSEGTSAETVRRALKDVPRDAFTGARIVGQHVAGHSHPPSEVIGRMLEALELQPTARLLLIGNGSGYVAAVASRIASQVFAVEHLAELVELASARLRALGFANVTTRLGDGQLGWPEAAPFDAVLVIAGLKEVPRAALGQLAIGGRLVMTTSTPGRSGRRLLRITRTSRDDFSHEELQDVVFTADIAALLLETGLVTEDVVEAARADAKVSGRTLDDELLRRTRLDQSDVFRALAKRHGVEAGNLDDILSRADLSLFAKLPRAYLDHHGLIPLYRDGDSILFGVCDPKTSVDDLAQAFPGSKLATRLLTPTDFRRLWTILDLRLRSAKAADVAPNVDRDLVTRATTSIETRFVKLFEALVLDAIGERASDLHLERYGERVRVRMRIDGDLTDIDRYTLSVADLLGVTSVIKVRASLDIADHRRPQGGRIHVRASDSGYDLRVQTQPSLYGEHVTVRFLPQDEQPPRIEDLGFPVVAANLYRRLLDSPSGLVLVVGPTGSGKSTTLYAGLHVLAKDSTRKVITVEDPIEYALDGVQQTQVQLEIGFAFADAMRVFVREDPDVILVGEIRDGETALEAIRAGQTGHLVLSTLHCNDAVDAVQRLIDLGMHPNSIASELLAVIAQRLARRVCVHCRQVATPDQRLMSEIFPDGTPADFSCFAGTGCPRCSGRGTRGRVAVIEYMRAGIEIRRAIAHRVPVDDLRRVALAAGLSTMRENALDHVANGTIPLQELAQVLSLERMAPERRGEAIEMPLPAYGDKPRDTSVSR